MSNKSRTFRLSETAIEYIEKFADENNCTLTDSIETIIREHKNQSSAELDLIADAVINKFDEKYKNLFTRLRLGTNFTDRNVQILLELMNTLTLYLKIPDGLTTRVAKSKPYETCENDVKDRIAEFKQNKDNKVKGTDEE